MMEDNAYGNNNNNNTLEQRFAALLEALHSEKAELQSAKVLVCKLGRLVDGKVLIRRCYLMVCMLVLAWSGGKRGSWHLSLAIVIVFAAWLSHSKQPRLQS
jgi:hypothetical protein